MQAFTMCHNGDHKKTIILFANTRHWVEFLINYYPNYSNQTIRFETADQQMKFAMMLDKMALIFTPTIDGVIKAVETN